MGAVSFPLTPAQIAAALSFPATVTIPAVNVAAMWPLIEGCMENLGMAGDRICIAAAATIRVECPSFKPQHELGGERYWTQHYEGRADLGNTEPGDGARYHGRGLVQLTGRGNYREYGRQLGIDLEGDPDKALEPNAAAAIFATYFYQHGVLKAANGADWKRVRRLVNGGENGWPVFATAVARLEHAIALQASAQTESAAAAAGGTP
jgi:hypothetical protein